MRQGEDGSRTVVSRAWLYRRYVTQQRSAQQIADESGWSSQYIRDRLRGYGIALRPPGTASTTGTRLAPDELHRALAQGQTVRQIAAEAGYSVTGVYRMIGRHQLRLPAASTQSARQSPQVLAEVVRLYRDERLGLGAVGARFGHGSLWARARVIQAGIPIRAPGRPSEMGWLGQLEQLVEQGLSTAQIAERVTRSPATVSQRLREAGHTAARPPARPVPEAAVLRRLYVEQQHTIAEIAQLLGLPARRVSRGLVQAGIARRRAGARVDRPGQVRIGAVHLRELYLTRGQSVGAIAAALGCSRTRVLTALACNGIPTRPGPWRPPAFELDPDTLRALYVGERLADEVIAARYAVPAHRVRQRRRELAIVRAPSAPPHPPIPSVLSPAVLAGLYQHQQLTLAQIARQHHTSSSIVRQWLLAAGIAVKPRTSRRDRKRLDLDRVRTLYVDREWSAAEIAAELDTTQHMVLRTLHENAVPVRPSGSRRTVADNDGEQQLTALYADPDVATLLQQHHMPRRERPGSVSERFPTAVPLTQDLLRQAYTDIGLAARHIELLTGQPAEQILDALHATDIPVRHSGMSPWLAHQLQQRARPRRRARARSQR